jgi:putative oxidoreductase
MQTTQQASRYVFPALGALYERCQRFAYPILRVAYGLWFVPHGCQKLFGWFGGNIAGTAKGMAGAGIEPAMFWAYYIGTLELVGGLLLAVGFLTRPIAALFFGFMFVAAFHVNIQAGYFWTSRGMEMPLLLLVLSVVILIRGGGDFSVDRRIGREV